MIAKAAGQISLMRTHRNACLGSWVTTDVLALIESRLERSGLPGLFCFEMRVELAPPFFVLVSKRCHDARPRPYALVKRLQVVFLVGRMDAVVDQTEPNQ